LTVRTLENPSQDIGITCMVNGFYRNDSNESSGHFSPGPSTRSNPSFSYTLMGCVNQLSPSFAKNLTVYFNSILNTEPYFLTRCVQTSNTWLFSDTHKSEKEDLENTVMPLFGLDPRVTREWNEEFQVVKNFPKENFLQRVQKDRAVNKVYNDFVDAA